MKVDVTVVIVLQICIAWTLGSAVIALGYPQVEIRQLFPSLWSVPISAAATISAIWRAAVYSRLRSGRREQALYAALGIIGAGLLSYATALLTEDMAIYKGISSNAISVASLGLGWASKLFEFGLAAVSANILTDALIGRRGF